MNTVIIPVQASFEISIQPAVDQANDFVAKYFEKNKEYHELKVTQTAQALFDGYMQDRVKKEVDTLIERAISNAIDADLIRQAVKQAKNIKLKEMAAKD